MFQVTLERLNTEFEMWSFPGNMENYGIHGSLVKMEGVCPGGGTLVYFACKDCAVEALRIEEAGGQIHKEKNIHRSVWLHGAGGGYGG